MTQSAICDSACLIGLERIDQLDILASSFERVYVPDAVHAEFGALPEWITVMPIKNRGMVVALRTQIHAGESEAIVLATERTGVVLILDDKKARRIAQQVGLQLIGTVGLIVRAKNLGIVDAISPILDALQEVDFRISESLYLRALRLAEED